MPCPAPARRPCRHARLGRHLQTAGGCSPEHMCARRIPSSHDLWAWYLKCVGVECERRSSVFLRQLGPGRGEARAGDGGQICDTPKPPLPPTPAFPAVGSAGPEAGRETGLWLQERER